MRHFTYDQKAKFSPTQWSNDTIQSLPFNASGNYRIYAQARSARDSTQVSAWSDSLSMTNGKSMSVAFAIKTNAVFNTIAKTAYVTVSAPDMNSIRQQMTISDSLLSALLPVARFALA
jgi:hypothetical protein